MDKGRANYLTARLIAGTLTDKEREELLAAYEQVAARTASEEDDDDWD